jgi:hypothetical protein
MSRDDLALIEAWRILKNVANYLPDEVERQTVLGRDAALWIETWSVAVDEARKHERKRPWIVPKPIRKDIRQVEL